MRKPVRILLLSANPPGTAMLHLEREAREIRAALEKRTRILFGLRICVATRWRDLRREMTSYNPHFVHFLGHSEEASIVLEGGDGLSRLATTGDLESFFEMFKNNIRCIFFNRCFSLTQAEAIARHIPFIIGTHEEISDEAAIEFSIAFYEAIGQAEKVPVAFQYGVQALKLADLYSESKAPVLIQGNKARSRGPAFRMAHPEESEDADNIGSSEPGLVRGQQPIPSIPRQSETGGPCKIFISYAREDVAYARRLFSDLKNAGFAPWLDAECLLPGQRWESAIEQAIKNCRIFLAVLSSRSLAKRGYVQKEIRRALDLFDQVPDSDIFLIPARLDDCEPSHLSLREVQWVDLFPVWEEGMERIFKSLRSIVNPDRR